jgi:hypothetical protein
VLDRIKQGAAKQYSMREAECHSAIAKCSLKYLIEIQQPLSEGVLEESALARYSAEFWSRHLPKTGVEIERVSQLVMRLMDFNEPAYFTWIQLHDPDRPWGRPNLKKSADDIATPLYYAAQLGLIVITKLQLDKDADVNAQGGSYGNALQAASYGGHKQVVKMLLDAGAHQPQEDHFVSRPV